MSSPTEFTAWLNGEFVPDSAAVVSVHDRGFFWGDAAIDTIRTFNGEAFQVTEHLDRLFQACNFLSLDPGFSKEEIGVAVREVSRRSYEVLEPDSDLWLMLHVTRGAMREGYRPGTTVVVAARPLPLSQRAIYYRDGIPIATASSVRRTPPWAVPPTLKTHNFLNLILADLEVASVASPGTWALVLDEHGNIAEGIGCNFFAVRDATLYTPKLDYVLDGISRATVIRLAGELDIPVVEGDIQVKEVLTADEAFLTSTSLCLCGIASLNGRRIGTGGFPGRVTAALLDAYSELAEFDIAGQYLRHLDSAVPGGSGWVVAAAR